MYENKIEKFTDRLFFKSKKTRSSLSLNFKSLLPVTKNKYQILQSQCTQPDQLDYNQSQAVHKKHEKFRQSKQEIGLSKADIDKLELMCVDLRAEDYLAKLIQIYQQEKVLKDQADLQLINNQQKKQECRSQSEKKSEQFKLFGEKQEPAKISDKCKLLITQCSQKMQQVNQKREAEVKQNISKKKIKLQNLQHRKDEKSLKRNYKDKEKYENTGNKNSQFLFVTKQSKSRQKTNKFSQKIEQRNKKKQQVKIKINNRNINDTQKSITNNSNGKTFYSQNRNLLTPTINFISTASSNDLQKQFKLKSAKDDLNQIKQYQHNRTQQQIKNSNQKVYYEQRQVSNSKVLEEMCYAQIGKRMVTVIEKQMPQQFFKANLHIRSYIMKSIVSYIQYLAQLSPNSIFILPNERGLHYQPNQKPPILCKYLQHTRYIQIIKTINHIIQKNIFKQKYKQSQASYWPYVLIFMFLCMLIMMFLIIFVHPGTNQNKNQNNVNQLLMICSGFVICVIMVVLVGYSFYCHGKNMEFVPACDMIQQEISAYFRFLNGKMENDLEWIIGESFFWVQVKIRTKKDKQNQLIKMKKKKQKSFQYFQRNKHKENIQDLYKNKKDKIIEYASNQQV